jgi:hypothetical protein
MIHTSVNDSCPPDTVHPQKESYLSAEDVASLFGISGDELPQRCRELIEIADLSYRVTSADEMNRIVLNFIKIVDENGPIVRSEHVNRRMWNRVWAKSLSTLNDTGNIVHATIPPYFVPPEFIRLRREFVLANHPTFFMNVYTVYRTWAFLKFFQEYDSIYEFGCGSCSNLSLLANLFPDKRLVGLDIATAPLEMIRHLALTESWKVEGKYFDMFRPDHSIRVAPGSAVLTVTALEQIGPRFERFLEFLIQKRPSLCVHLEPILEWYDEALLGDYLALRYHKKHGYLEGFWSRLKQLETLGIVEILEGRRLEFGAYHDACSLVVWRPRGQMRLKGWNGLRSKVFG